MRPFILIYLIYLAGRPIYDSCENGIPLSWHPVLRTSAILFSRVFRRAERGKFKSAETRSWYRWRKFRAAEYFPLNLVAAKTHDKWSSITAACFRHEILLDGTRKIGEEFPIPEGSSASIPVSCIIACDYAATHTGVLVCTRARICPSIMIGCEFPREIAS